MDPQELKEIKERDAATIRCLRLHPTWVDRRALIAEVEKLQALKKYARHKGNCLLSGNLRTRVCTCGLKEALANA